MNLKGQARSNILALDAPKDLGSSPSWWKLVKTLENLKMALPAVQNSEEAPKSSEKANFPVSFPYSFVPRNTSCCVRNGQLAAGTQKRFRSDFWAEWFCVCPGLWGVDWIALTWTPPVLVCPTNALPFSPHLSRVSPPFPVWSINLTQEIWCGYVSHLYYRITTAL